MAAITPERSEPSVRGNGCGKALRPDRIQPSQGPTPAAWTCTRTSPSPGSGRGTGSKDIASGGPKACTRQAIVVSFGTSWLAVIRLPPCMASWALHYNADHGFWSGPSAASADMLVERFQAVASEVLVHPLH